jgi:hypothetical protein
VAPAGAPSAIDRRDVRLAVLAILVAAIVYNANFRSVSAGDSRPARYIPFALWRDHTIYLDPFIDLTIGGFEPQYWVQDSRNGHRASNYPIASPILVAPLYLPAVIFAEAHDWNEAVLGDLSYVMEKLVASLVASVGVGWMYLLLRRRTDRRNALLLTTAYAFGTTTWAISSQALWQHGPAQLMVIAVLWFITERPSPLNSAAAGLATGFLTAIRPPDIAISFAFAIAAVLWICPRRKDKAHFALCCIAPLLLVSYYNLATFRTLAGGYRGAGVTREFFSHPPLEGVAGYLVSPTRGLFVFSPFLLFLPLFFRRALADERWKKLTLTLLGGLMLLLLVYSRVDFRQGYSFGPRFLSDILPILFWMLAPVLPSLNKPLRTGFLAAALIAIWIQSVGAFRYTDKSETVIIQSTANAWKWRNAPFLVDATGPRQPPTILEALQRLSNQPRP